MVRLRLPLLAALALLPAILPVRSSATVVVEPVSFHVTNPLEVGAPGYTVRGFLYRPAQQPSCSDSVMLLLHGLSYGAWAWDFPIQPEIYSVARALADNGYPAIAIDELGYGSSDHPNGYTLTVESYAAITSEIVRQLRGGLYAAATPTAFAAVGLMGHSAGTEISELTAGIYGGVDALVATAYTHFPSQRIVTDFVTGDMVRAAQADTEYFGGTPEQRREYMYNVNVANAAVMDEDTRLANPTPSGEIFSISNQPSRWVMGAITAPVLLLLAQNDLLFPAEFGDEELMLFARAADKELYVAPTAGHSFMLHPNAPQTNEAVLDWLEEHPVAIPDC